MLESLSTDKLDYEKLSLEEQQKRGILGRLTGVIADFVNPTRNGRKYSEKLWEHVFNDPIMQEKIKNRCCFGELGHPADRTEVDMEKIALCLAEVPKKGKDGKLHGIFDILDTPNGRILKCLCDYGCNIGVSSRGEGDLITGFDGEDEVDPDTYVCECWDAVITPSVQTARMAYVHESLETKSTLKESLDKLINASSDDDKKVMNEGLKLLGLKLNEEQLKKATPYMLRNDGKLLSCGDIHPYIKNHIEEPDDRSIKQLLDSNYLDWFYKNTNSNAARNELKSLVKSFIACDYISNEDMKNLVSFDYDDAKYVDNIAELKELYHEVNDMMNQEFCKVRTSDLRFGGNSNDIYFRISSVGFNWFDLIWNLVYNNKNWISNVTIVKDTQSFGGRVNPYKIHGQEINHMPINEFITLSGNPVVESKQYKSEIMNSANKLLSEGKDLLEAFGSIHPKYINNYMSMLKEDYIERNFSQHSYSQEETPVNNIEEEGSLAVDNNEADNELLTQLQESLQTQQRLLDNVSELQEKLSVSYTKETTYQEEIEKYQKAIVRLKENVNRLKIAENKIQKLQEQLKESNQQIQNQNAICEDLKQKLKESTNQNKTLNESLEKINSSSSKSITQLNNKVTELMEQISTLKDSNENDKQKLSEEYESKLKDSQIKQKELNGKVEKYKSIAEKYQKIALKSVDKYIESKAVSLGISANEIKNRLSETYTFTDIDNICENLRQYKININNLPFSSNTISKQITESSRVSTRASKNESILPKNKMYEDVDEVDEQLLSLAGIN